MIYSILFSLSAKKQLQKLEKDTQRHIIAVLERIRFRPEKFVKKLTNDPGYRLRVGDYRVIMDIKKDKLLILILKIGHRKTIYKTLRH